VLDDVRIPGPWIAVVDHISTVEPGRGRLCGNNTRSARPSLPLL
jgi:hypothetical protein